MTRLRAKGLILAGGEGGAATPLLPIANRPIFVYGIQALREAGVREVGVVVSPATAEAVVEAVSACSELDVELTWLQAERPLGAMESLLAAEDFLEQRPCVVHRADGLLRHDIGSLVGEVETGDSDAVLLVEQSPGRPATIEDGRVLRLLGRARPTLGGLGVAGVHVFGPRFLDHARAAASRDVASALKLLLKAGGRARTAEMNGCWRTVSDAASLLEVNRIVLDELPSGPATESYPDSSVQGRVRIHPSAEVESTIIRGPAVIGAGAVLRDAYIGPYSAIGEGVRIEGAEIEHSIVLPGAVIEHLGARLEASVVGRGARIYRDFALPRAFRLRVGDDTEVALA